MTERALIVEDDPDWQAILTELLTDSGLAVDCAANLHEAERAIQFGPHRLAVVDLSLRLEDHANQDGLSILSRIHQQNPACLSILLTGFATVELAVSALKTYHAYTCLRKESFRRAEFRQLIQEALSAPPPGPVGPVEDPALAGLTQREREVLALLVRGLSNKEIAAQLYVTAETVKQHLKSIYNKLGVHTRAAAAAYGVTMSASARTTPANPAAYSQEDD